MDLTLVFMMFALVISVQSDSGVSQLSVSCSASGLRLRASFKKPFTGVMFAKGHFSHPACRYMAAPSGSLEINLNLPLHSCGTSFEKNSPNPWILNTVVFQHHALLRTINDTEEVATCRLSRSLPAIYWTMSILKRNFQNHQAVDSWLEVQYGSELLSKSSSKNLGLDHSSLLVLHVKDGGRNRDIKITSCLAHNESIITAGTWMQPLCKNCLDSSNTLGFIMTNDTLSKVSDKTAYLELNKLDFGIGDNVLITCGVELCKDSCDRGPHRMTIAKHKLIKRAGLLSLSDDQKILRSTIKALANKLRKQLSGKNTESTYSTDTEKETTSIPEDFTFPTEHRNFSVFKISMDDIASMNIMVNNSNYTDIYADDTFSTMLFTDSYQTEMVLESKDVKFGSTLETEPLEGSGDLSETIEIEMGTETFTEWTEAFSNSNELATESASTIHKLDDLFHRTLNVGDFVKDYVPKVRFNLVITVLGVIIASLVLFSIGMTLYYRKENKRHYIDNFLLYNF